MPFFDVVVVKIPQFPFAFILCFQIPRVRVACFDERLLHVVIQNYVLECRTAFDVSLAVPVRISTFGPLKT